VDVAADPGEVDQAVGAGVDDSGPLFPALEDSFDVSLQHVWVADGDFGVIVGTIDVCDRNELAGSIEDARVVLWCLVTPEAQLVGLAVVVDEVPGVSEIDVHDCLSVRCLA
jgi:hypothetical protein